VSSERPPGGDEEDDDRGLTSGDPLRAPGDDEPAGAAPAPPPPPWRRDPPAEPEAAPESWRPYPEDDVTEPVPDPLPDPEPISVPEPEPEPEPTEARSAFGDEPAPDAAHAFGAPEAPSPREGSVAPPGYGGASSIPPGVTVPPQRAPAQPAVPAQRYVLSGWWRRAAAQVIDGIVIGVVVTLIIILITAAAGGVGFLGGDTTGYGGIILGLLFSTLIATGVALLYAPLYMARTNGQTLGKQAMGIRVVRPKGQPVDFLWSVLREVVVKTLLFAGIGGSFTFGLAWLLDILWPLWDDQNRALHDLIVDSRVVRA
jgi:uncharacterized RDD family membrane protein YckC